MCGFDRKRGEGAEMSEGGIKVNELIDLKSGKDPAFQRSNLSSAKSSEELKEKIAERSKLIQWDAVADVLQDKLVETLDIPVLSLLYPAWAKFSEIRELADPQKHPKTETLLVSLADHAIEAERHPALIVSYHGIDFPKIEFTLKAQVTLNAVVLKIQDGKILELKTGTMTGKATLLLEEKTVLEKPFGTVSLPGRLDFGEGINLRGET